MPTEPCNSAVTGKRGTSLPYSRLFKAPLGLLGSEKIQHALFLSSRGKVYCLCKESTAPMCVSLLAQQPAFKDENVGVPQVIACFNNEVLGPCERLLRHVQTGRVFIEVKMPIE